jgi:hypothetical protein
MTMKVLATLPPKGRDLRLDLFRGVANWGIFLDHIPNNIVNWVTTRNYGFRDAADLASGAPVIEGQPWRSTVVSSRA